MVTYHPPGNRKGSPWKNPLVHVGVQLAIPPGIASVDWSPVSKIKSCLGHQNCYLKLKITPKTHKVCLERRHSCILHRAQGGKFPQIKHMHTYIAYLYGKKKC